MNTNKPANPIHEISLQKATKLAGISILTFMVLSAIHFTSIDANLGLSKNISTIVNFITSNELLFRIGIVLDLIIFLTGALLAIALYTILKSLNRNIALIGLFVMMIQATLAIIIELTSFISLSLLSGKAYLQGFETEQLHSLLGVILKLRIDGFNITGMIFSLGMVFFFYLFLKSKYIFKSLAIWGLISFSLNLIMVLLKLFLPYLTNLIPLINVISMIAMASVFLVQITIGLWLLLKGLRPKN